MGLKTSIYAYSTLLSTISTLLIYVQVSCKTNVSSFIFVFVLLTKRTHTHMHTHIRHMHIHTYSHYFVHAHTDTRKDTSETEEGNIVPMYKKGSRAECGNYRGISLLSVVGKIYCIHHLVLNFQSPPLLLVSMQKSGPHTLYGP